MAVKKSKGIKTVDYKYDKYHFNLINKYYIWIIYTL